MFKKFNETINKVDHTYLLMFLIFTVLNRMDDLVCGPLINIDYAHQVSWWVLLSTLVVFIAIIFYYNGGQTKQALWHSILFFELGVGGFLDILYGLFALPFPQMWLDTNFVHFWHPAYLLFGYPWTIKEQAVEWIVLAIVVYLTWWYFNRKYHVYGLKKRNVRNILGTTRRACS